MALIDRIKFDARSCEIMVSKSFRGASRSVVLILLCFTTVFVIVSRASAQTRQPESVVVVSQDNAEIFFHRDGNATGFAHPPKGTRLKVQSRSGNTIFTTYDGKPAYIHSEFVTAEKLYFESEQRAKGLVQYSNEWVTPAEKFRREQMAKGLVEYGDQWVTPEVKSHLEQGHVLFAGEWVTPKEKYRREQVAKGLVEFQGEWVKPEFKTNREKGLVEYEGKWVTPQRKEKLESECAEAERRAAAERNLASLRTAVVQGNYEYASQFVGDQYPLPPIAQLDPKLRSWVEKASALAQVSSAVENGKRFVAQERARIQDAQTPKYEAYYSDENVTFTCTWCGGRGVAGEGCIGCPGGDTYRYTRCPVCGGSGQLTRRIPVRKQRELPRPQVSMDRLNALQQELSQAEAKLADAAEKERASRKDLVGLLSGELLIWWPRPLRSRNDLVGLLPAEQATPQLSQPDGTIPVSQSVKRDEQDFEKTLRELFPAQYQNSSQPSSTEASAGDTEAQRLRKRLNAVNERMAQIFDALQRTASVPTEQSMANAMNGGKAYTDQYNSRNDTLKREWTSLEQEKAGLERQLAKLGDTDSRAQTAERGRRTNPRYVADDYLQVLIDGGSVKSARYLDTKAMFDGVFVIYWFDYVDKAGLRREGQYVVRLRKGNTGEWEVFNSYPAEVPVP